MSKRVIALMQVLILLVMFAGCKKNTKGEYSEFTSTIVIDETGDGEQGTDNTGESGQHGGKSQTGKSQTVQSGNKGNKTANIQKGASVANLDFGGKTVKMAITNDKTPTNSTKRMFADFEKQYNCKLSYDVINFGDFLKTLSAKLAGNQPYDIVYLHGSMFPAAAINRLLQPLDDAISDSDKYNSSNPSKGGIDMHKTDYYLWNNKHYGVAGQNDVNVMLCYYNKNKFKDAGLEDPLTLSQNGQWTWDKFIEMGKRVTDQKKGVYFCDHSVVGIVVNSFGGQYIKYNSPTDVKENTSDPKIFSGLKLLQRMAYGQDKILNTEAGSTSDPSQFLNGNTYIYVSEDIRYTASISNAIIDKKKLGGNTDVVGICPVPLGDGNTSYPAGYVQGVGSMRGSSDIRYAVAFAYFRANWQDTKSDKYQMPEYARKMVKEYTSSPNTLFNRYSYDSNDGTGESSVEMRVHFIQQDVIAGNDIAKSLNKYKGSIQNAIDVTLRKK